MTNSSIKSNLAWKLMERGCSQGITFLITIILARILSPEEFGTVTLLMVFINLMQVFVDSGMGSALIQKGTATDIDYSTVLYFNMILCVVLYCIMFFASPFIAKYYGNDELVPVIRALCTIILISGIKNIQVSRVASMMAFNKLFFATSVGAFASAVIGITMAYRGAGIWALVVHNILNNFFSTVILWVIMRWVPLFCFSISSLKRLASFGWKVFVTSIINTIYDDITVLIIGKKYSTDQLAYYDQGRKYPQVIISNINSSIDSVLFPAMSNCQEDIDKIKNFIKKSISYSCYILFPLMTWLAVCSHDLIILILTEKWLPAYPYILLFCFFYSLYPFNTANLNAIKATGKGNLLLRLEMIKKLYGIIILLFTVNHGVHVIAAGLVLNGFINFIVNALPINKIVGCSIMDELKEVFPTILISLLFGLSIYFFGYMPISNLIIKLVIQTLGGLVIYLLFSQITKNEAYLYFQKNLYSFIKKI